MQSVGIYADDSAARATSDRLTAPLTECSALNAAGYGYTVETKDPSTIFLNFPLWKIFYRVKASTLIVVKALGFANSEQVANDVLQKIVDRIK